MNDAWRTALEKARGGAQAAPAWDTEESRRLRSRPRNCEEARVVVETQPEYVARVRELRRKTRPPLDVGRMYVGVDEGYEEAFALTAWELVVLARHWTEVYEEYRAITLQTSTRWWFHLYALSNRRVCRLEDELARRVRRMCDDIDERRTSNGRRGDTGGIAALLEEMAHVWNLGPVAGLHWNEFGFVPTFRLARAVRRAAELVGMTDSQRRCMAKARVRWRSRRGFEYYDDYIYDVLAVGHRRDHDPDAHWRRLVARDLPGVDEQTTVADYCEKPGDRVVLLSDPDDGTPLVWITMDENGGRHFMDVFYPDEASVSQGDDSGMPLILMIMDWMIANDWGEDGGRWQIRRNARVDCGNRGDAEERR
jgi:hypothetical protein